MTLPPPIKPLRVEVAGIHPRYARLLIIEIELDQAPTPRWIELFHLAAQSLPWIEMHPPKVTGSKIVLTPTDGDLEDEVAHVEERVQLANTRWREELEMSQPEPISAESFSEDIRDRIAAARLRTRTMSEAFSVQGFWRSDAWETENLMSLETTPTD